MKIILWIPYILSQCLLIAIIVKLHISTNISESNAYLIGALIALYGGLLVLSSDVRRKYWPKGDNHDG